MVHHALRNLLKCTFGLNWGDTDEEIESYLQKLINYKDNTPYYQIYAELKQAFIDPDFDWVELLNNEEYETGFPDTDTPFTAKKFVIDRIWNKLYPDEKIEM